MEGTLEGRDSSLLNHPPLRTGLATFTASGSSTTNSILNTLHSRMDCFFLIEP